MVNGTLLVVGFFAVVIRLLAVAAPAPFFWYGDYDSDSSEEEDNIKKVFVYINVSSPGYGFVQPGVAQIPLGTGNAGNPANSMPGTPFTVPVMVQFTMGNGSGTSNSSNMP